MTKVLAISQQETDDRKRCGRNSGKERRQDSDCFERGDNDRRYERRGRRWADHVEITEIEDTVDAGGETVFVNAAFAAQLIGQLSANRADLKAPAYRQTPLREMSTASGQASRLSV